MIADDISHGHILLADWFLLFAAVGFVVAAVADHLAGRSTAPGTAPTLRSPGRYVRPVALVALALVALAFLVL